MRRAKRSMLAIGSIGVLLATITIGGTCLDNESTAQTPGQPVPTEPAQPAQPVQPAPGGPQAPPPAPVLDVPSLMQLFNKPLYMGLKEKMAQQPANEEQWKDLMGRGLQGAEIANLVALRKVEGPREPLLRGAAGLQRASIAFADAAKAQQWDVTVQAYQGLVQSCNNCHQALAPDKAPQLKP
jgi:hypothetical protein